MNAPRTNPYPFTASQPVSRPAADLPALEGASPSRLTSGAGHHRFAVAGPLGPLGAGNPAPKDVLSHPGPFGAAVFTDEGDLTDLPEPCRRAPNRFVQRADATHNRESSMGRPGVPLGVRPQPPP